MKTVLTIAIIVTVLYSVGCLEYQDRNPTVSPDEVTNNPSHVPENEGGSYVCFQNREKGLPWPIGNPRDIAGAIFHGSHCVDAALDYVAYKSNRTAAYLHVSHCRTIVKMALKYFDEHPKYSVPEEICDDLVELASDESCDRSSGKVRCKRWARPLILLGVMWGTTPQKRLFPRSTAGAEESDAHKVYPDLTHDTRDQRELYVRISNENVDRVFTKHWENSTDLTQEELAFVEKWHHPAIHRLSAMGLFCREGDGKAAPIDLLKKVLAVMPEEEYAHVM